MFGFGNSKQDQCSCNQKNESVLEKDATQTQQIDNDEQNDLFHDKDACLNELALLKEKFVRLGADFQNYKKRAEKDRVETIERAKSDVLLGFLQVSDNFDRALQEAHVANNEQLNEWLKGFELINKVLNDLLKEQGVEQITENELFDPTVHEAIAQLESPDHTTGQVIDLFEKGYRYKGKVLRTAKVTVAK